MHTKVIFKDWKVENSGTQFFLHTLFAETFVDVCTYHDKEETYTSQYFFQKSYTKLCTWIKF